MNVQAERTCRAVVAYLKCWGLHRIPLKPPMIGKDLRANRPGCFALTRLTSLRSSFPNSAAIGRSDSISQSHSSYCHDNGTISYPFKMKKNLDRAVLTKRSRGGSEVESVDFENLSSSY